MEIQFLRTELGINNQEQSKLKEFTDFLSLEFIFIPCQSEIETKYLRYNFEISKKELSKYGNFGIEIDSDISYKLCCKSQLILQEIEYSSYTGAFKNLFIQTKAIELLLINLNYINNIIDNKCYGCKFLNQPLEKDKIVKAKEIIDLHQGTYPSIAVLSLWVGINQCYLKKGFKELFNQTISEYIGELKLTKAKHLLLTSDTSIQEIAHKLGYSNSSNFSNAFKNQLGVSPIEFRS
jgi:AraC-like DNA-binding protein